PTRSRRARCRGAWRPRPSRRGRRRGRRRSCELPVDDAEDVGADFVAAASVRAVAEAAALPYLHRADLLAHLEQHLRALDLAGLLEEGVDADVEGLGGGAVAAACVPHRSSISWVWGL